MNYRYRMHWYSDPEGPLNGGRPLFGDMAAAAIAQATRLWDQGAYAAASGYCVVDTDEGEVIWRGRRHHDGVGRAGPLRSSEPKR